jgi:hypothetical protein
VPGDDVEGDGTMAARANKALGATSLGAGSVMVVVLKKTAKLGTGQVELGLSFSALVELTGMIDTLLKVQRLEESVEAALLAAAVADDTAIGSVSTTLGKELR